MSTCQWDGIVKQENSVEPRWTCTIQAKHCCTIYYIYLTKYIFNLSKRYLQKYFNNYITKLGVFPRKPIQHVKVLPLYVGMVFFLQYTVDNIIINNKIIICKIKNLSSSPEI